MKVLLGFELRPLDDRQRSELFDPSGRLRTRIDGAVLEVVYELKDGCLIVTSDGDAFEECLHVTLCGVDFAPLEVVHLGGAYKTGTFRGRGVGTGPRVRFSFFSDEVWQLEVLPERRWRLRLPRPLVRHEPAFRPGRLRLVRQASPR